MTTMNKPRVEVGGCLDGEVYVRFAECRPLVFNSLDDAQNALRVANNQLDLLRIPE